MKNFKFSGQSFKYTVAGADVLSGDVVSKGELIGIAVVDGKIGEVIEVQRTGVVETKKSEVVAFTQGDSVYYDIADADVNADAANPLMGYAYEDKLAGDTHINVALVAGAAAFN